MTTVRNTGDREALLRRFDRLKPDTRPQWGKLDAPGMVTHVTDTMRSGLGEVVIPPSGPLQYWPINVLMMFYFPWPKGAPTAPALIARKPEELTAEINRLRDVMNRLAGRDEHGPWPPHAAFGRINGTQWGRLMYRHMDHHLTQFGV